MAVMTMAQDVLHLRLLGKSRAQLSRKLHRADTGPRDVSEHAAEKVVDAVNAGRRVRKQEVLTTVSSLGDIHLVDSGHIPSLLQEADCFLMSNSVQHREPEIHQERLRCGEAAEASWKGVLLSCVLEPCMYHMRYKGTPMYLCIYVDDIIMACSELGIHIRD